METERGKKSIQALLSRGPRVINLGLEGFAIDLRSKGTPVIHVRWKPPAMGDESLLRLLDSLR